MEPLTIAKGVSKDCVLGEVTIHTLSEVSLETENEELIVIWGSGGLGKSTLLNVLGGIDTVTAGEIYYQDQALHLATKKEITNYRRAHIGLFFNFTI